MNLTNEHIKQIIPFTAPFFVEMALFNMASEYSETYNGGQWTVAETNGVLHFVAPEDEYTVVNGDNFYEGTMTHDQYGRALTVLLYNRCLWDIANEGAEVVQAASDRFYDIRDALVTDSEISRFLD